MRCFLLSRLAKSTSGVNNINSKQLAALQVPLPEIEQQRNVIGSIEAAFAAIDRLATEARSAMALLDRLDQAMLAKAFRGELVPQDPNDEPASLLLQRIRAGHAAGRKPRPVSAGGGQPEAPAYKTAEAHRRFRRAELLDAGADRARKLALLTSGVAGEVADGVDQGLAALAPRSPALGAV